jgi:hypothetical protein
MNRNVKIGLISVAVIAFLGLMLFLRGGAREHYTPIPENTIGNTAGNLRGDGMFCEYGGKIYFANPYDNNSLYSMNADNTNIKKLNSSSCKFILAGGDYLFYYIYGASGGGQGLGYLRSITGVYRSNLDGQDPVCINGDMATSLQLVGNNIYYMHYDKKSFSSFNKLAADKSSETMLAKKDIDTACVSDGVIYYGGQDGDHNLHGFNTRIDTDEVIWHANLCNPTRMGSYIYYMDIGNKYRLCRYDMNNNVVQVLTNDSLEFYNVYEGVIFYQRSNDPALMRMNTDGSNLEMVQEGIYNRINTTSVYTYFYSHESDTMIYRTPTLGFINVDMFPEALDAVRAQTK